MHLNTLQKLVENIRAKLRLFFAKISVLVPQVFKLKITACMTDMTILFNVLTLSSLLILLSFFTKTFCTMKCSSLWLFLHNNYGIKRVGSYNSSFYIFL